MAPAQLAEELTQLSAPVTFSGDGVDPYRTLFAEALGARFSIAGRWQYALFCGGGRLRLACAKDAAREISDVAALAAGFLCVLSEAEENRLEALERA